MLESQMCFVLFKQLFGSNLRPWLEVHPTPPHQTPGATGWFGGGGSLCAGGHRCGRDQESGECPGARPGAAKDVGMARKTGALSGILRGGGKFAKGSCMQCFWRHSKIRDSRYICVSACLFWDSDSRKWAERFCLAILLASDPLEPTDPAALRISAHSI